MDHIGHYRIIRELGRGAMGVVYEAVDDKLQRRVALKVLPQLLAADARTVERFAREAQAIAQLQHPHIVGVYDVGESDGVRYFAMQFIDGQPLDEVIDRQRLAYPRLAEIVRDAALALAYAHGQGVIHRDIKPANLMLAGDGTIYLADFGLARTAGGSKLTLSGDTLGTPMYMSPEQVRGDGLVDARTDIYSLGATLYELLTLQPPFAGDSAQALTLQVLTVEPRAPEKAFRGVPRDLAVICQKAMEKNPARRYPDARALADDLDRFLAGVPITARPAGRFRRMAAWVGHHRAVTVMAAALCLMAVVAVGRVIEERDAANLTLARLYARRGDEARLVECCWSDALLWYRKSLGYDSLVAVRFGVMQVPDLRVLRGSAAGLRGRTLVLAPGGTRAATATGDTQITVWNLTPVAGRDWLDTGNVPRADGRVMDYPASLAAYDLAEAGACVIAGGSDGVVIAAGSRQYRLPAHAGPVNALVAGNWNGSEAFASTAADCRVTVRRVADGSTLADWRATAVPQALALSPAGTLLAVAEDSYIVLYRPGQAAPAGRLAMHRGLVYALAFSPDGRTLAAGGADRTISVWDSATGRHLLTLRGHRNRVDALAFSRDGAMLASGSSDQTVKLWRAADGELLGTLKGHTAWVTAVAFSPDGTLLLSSDVSGEVRGWGTDLRSPARIISAHRGQVNAVAVLPDGSALVSAGDDGLVRLWDARELLRPRDGSADGSRRDWRFGGAVNALSVRPDGKEMAVAGEDGFLHRCALAGGMAYDTLAGAAGPLTAAAYAPDGGALAAAGDDGIVRMWPRGGDTPAQFWPAHAGRIYALAFSPDGKMLASGGRDRVVRVWESDSGRELWQGHGHGNWVKALAFQPGGGLLLSAASDWTARLWQAATGAPARVLRGHDDALYAAAFSRTGLRLATGSADGTVRIWSAASGDLAAVLEGHAATVSGVAFMDNDRWLVSGGRDGRIIIRTTGLLGTREEFRGLVDRKLGGTDYDVGVNGEMLAVTGNTAVQR